MPPPSAGGEAGGEKFQGIFLLSPPAGKESAGQSQPKAFLKTGSIIEPAEVFSPRDLMALLFTCNT